MSTHSPSPSATSTPTNTALATGQKEAPLAQATATPAAGSPSSAFSPLAEPAASAAEKPDIAVEPVLARWREAIRAAGAEGRRVAIVGGASKASLPWVAADRAAASEVIATREYAGVVRYDPAELVLTVRAGTPLAEVEALLAQHRQWLPFDPPRFDRDATIGGVIAAGLAGPARWGHGAVRDAVLGVRLLDGQGRLLRFGGEVMKNVAGYDVSRFLAGSWGVFGVIAEVSLKVLPQPPAVATLRFALTEGEAIAQGARWAQKPLPLSATCWQDGQLWLRLSGARAAVAEALAQLGGERLPDDEAAALWARWRDDPAGGTSTARLWRVSLPPNSPVLKHARTRSAWWGGALRWVEPPVDAGALQSEVAVLGGWVWRWSEATGPWHSARLPAVAAIEARLKAAFDPQGVFGQGPF